MSRNVTQHHVGLRNTVHEAAGLAETRAGDTSKSTQVHTSW